MVQPQSHVIVDDPLYFIDKLKPACLPLAEEFGLENDGTFQSLTLGTWPFKRISQLFLRVTLTIMLKKANSVSHSSGKISGTESLRFLLLPV